MVNNIYTPLLNFLPLSHLASYFHTPDKLYSSAGSALAAAGIGAGAGLVGRAVYPDSGIVPLHYSVWFGLAYQIKSFITLVESRFDGFMDIGAYIEFLEQIPEDALDFKDQFRYNAWKIIRYKTVVLNKIDQLYCYVFSVRPYAQVTVDNVYQSSFMEMCRYRVWKVFKSTIVDAVSISLAYHLCNATGFILPARSSAPLILIIQSITVRIIMVPALYCYINAWNKKNVPAVDAAEGENATPIQAIALPKRILWLNKLLPEM